VFKPDKEIDPLIQLIEVIRVDPVINEKVKQMLNLDSFNRRSALNKWILQLQKHKASEELIQALSCLFDDSVAQKTLSLITK